MLGLGVMKIYVLKFMQSGYEQKAVVIAEDYKHAIKHSELDVHEAYLLGVADEPFVERHLVCREIL